MDQLSPTSLLMFGELLRPEVWISSQAALHTTPFTMVRFSALDLSTLWKRAHGSGTNSTNLAKTINACLE